MYYKIEVKYKDKDRDLKGKIKGTIKEQDVFKAWCSCSNTLLQMNLEALEINIEEIEYLIIGEKEGVKIE